MLAEEDVWDPHTQLLDARPMDAQSLFKLFWKPADSLLEI